MKLKSIKDRLPKGELYIYRKKMNFLPDECVQYYHQYWNEVYFRGGKNIDMNKFIMEEDYFHIGNLKLPCLKSESEVYTFFHEFSDLLLPYLVSPESYNYQLIKDRFREGPYEIDNNVSLKSGDIVIDCGANMGLFSTIALSKGCKVFAFEPIQYMIDHFLKKLEYPEKQFFIEQYALTEVSNGIIELKETTCNLGCSHVNGIGDTGEEFVGDRAGTKMQENTESVFVEGVSLDDWVERNEISRIDFIKADIEGSERFMLKGARNVLRKMQPKLAICTYHFKEDPELLEKIILDANPNYIIKHQYKKLYAYVPK